jgi:Tfp pilus assembly pilus retraction ATPase PilT
MGCERKYENTKRKSADSTRARRPYVPLVLSNLIREGKTAQIVSAVRAGGEEGMLLLERCLGDLVRAQTVDVEAAKDAANDLNTLKHYLGRT